MLQLDDDEIIDTHAASILIAAARGNRSYNETVAQVRAYSHPSLTFDSALGYFQSFADSLQILRAGRSVPPPLRDAAMDRATLCMVALLTGLVPA
jgi:hypothetical protein